MQSEPLPIMPCCPGVSDEKRENAHKYLSEGSDMMQEFVANGDSWTMTTTTAVGAKTQAFTLGQEFESATLDGRPIKVRTKQRSAIYNVF